MDFYDTIVAIFETIVEVGIDYVWEFPADFPWIVVVLLGAGLFVTLRLGFPQLRRVPHSIRAIAGKYDDPDDPGDVNHFQALSTALSATVGIGNIGGVAVAVHLGGPGALFWMWITAVFGMALKFAECTLSLHYRSFDDEGLVAGGPMYYIERGLGKSWKPLAIFFALCAITASFGGGNMNQANTVALSAQSDFGWPNWIVGLVLAGLVFAVIVGGIKSIAQVTSRLVPFMAIVYVAGAILVIVFHAGEVPAAFATIFESAFSPEAGLGGAAAGTFMWTLLWGVRRGLFSNEAGQGSAPIAHAAARTDEPVREGAVAMLGPLIDTLIICTMTGLVVITTGVWKERFERTVPIGDVKAAPLGAKRCWEEFGDDAPAKVPVRISEGAQADLVWCVADAPVEGGLILKKGEPFTGELEYDVAEGAVVVPGDDFALSGEALHTSSPLTAEGFRKGLSPLGDWGNYLVTVAVFLFALSTMISWSYYGDRCVVYLFGSQYVLAYRIVFCFFVFIGATIGVRLVWAYGDLALGLMTVPNLIAVVLLSPKLVALARDYFKRMGEE